MSLEQDLRAEFGEAVLAGTPAEYLTDVTRAPGRADAVVLPASADEVAAVLAWCHERDVPVVPRGGGTGVAGGAVPDGGVVLALDLLASVRSFDPVLWRIEVEAGVRTARLQQLVRESGLMFAPDPGATEQSQVGGNIATNAGGPHAFKYGVVGDWVTGVEAALAPGKLVSVGGPIRKDVAGYDLKRLLVGSEGTLGIVTEVTVRLLRRPEAVRTLVADFPSAEHAGNAVSDIIAAGIIPAAVEMLDELAIEACEKATGAGYSLDTPAALVVELDGVEVEVEAEFARVQEICHRNNTTKIRIANDPAERALIWKGRKAAFAAMGRMSRDYFVQDGVIPRTKLGATLAQIGEMANAAGLRVANVFHAGDGNLHPLVLYDGTVPGQATAAEHLATAIVELCVEQGGSITGEHGVGSDKACSMPKMFSAADLTVMARVRAAFDPGGVCNPGKVLPTPRLCGERPGPWQPHPLEESGVIERF
jgi:glycolate oxidase